MVECDTCGDDVAVLWEHRSRSESMTHRRSEHLCADCHPYVSPGVVDSRAEATPSDDGAGAV